MQGRHQVLLSGGDSNQLTAQQIGVALLWQSALLLARARRGLTDAALKPMRLFHWTNSYLALLFVAAAVDTLIR